MSGIITEKSLGFSSRKNEPAERSGRKQIKPKLRGFPIKGAAGTLKLTGTAFLLVLSIFLFVYCGTTPPNEGSKDVSGPDTVTAGATLPAEGTAESAEPFIRRLPDNHRKIDSIPYPGDTLQGVFWKESNFDGKVYLTFDDGPNMSLVTGGGSISTVSDRILDILAERNLKASFFINGRNLEYANGAQKAELRRVLLRMIHEGHLIGNHSYHHHNLARGIFADGIDDEQDIADEFIMTQDILDDVLGFEYPMLLIRPPYAEPGRTDDLDNWLKSVGYYLISLHFDSYDYAYKSDGPWDKDAILERMSTLLEEQPSGGVILLHELETTAQILPDLLDTVVLSGELETVNLEYLLKTKYSPVD